MSDKEKKVNNVETTGEEKTEKKPKKTEAEAVRKPAEEKEIKEEEKKEELKDSEVFDLNNETTSNKDEKTKEAKKRSANDLYASKKRKKIIKRIVILSILAILCLVGYFFFKKKMDEAKALASAMTNKVQTATVEKKTLLDTVPATGTLVPSEAVTLSTILQSSSKIEEVNVDVGDYVEEGDVLVRFSTEDINKEISDTQEDIATQRQRDSISAEDSERQYINSYVTVANNLRSNAEKVDKALESLHEACSAYGDAKRALQAQIDAGASETVISSYQSKVDSALKTQESAQKSYDDAVEAQAEAIANQEYTLSSADSTYKSSGLTRGDQVKSSQRQLDKLQDSLDNYIVTASISGIVTSVNVSEGNSFQNGSVLTIQDSSSMEVEVSVDEYDIPKVKSAYNKAQDKGTDLQVEIKTNATEDNIYKGHVVLIAPTSTTTATYSTSASATSSSGSNSAASSSSSPQYKVKVSLDDKDDNFMIGMTAKVSIVVDESPADSLCVPYNALTEKEDGSFVVNVVDENGTPSDFPENDSEIVVENNTSQSGKGSRPQSSGGFGSGSRPGGRSGGPGMGGMGSITSMFSGSGNKKNNDFTMDAEAPKTREVKVNKIFETDYYIAVVPVNANELKEGDSVVIESETSSSNDMMAMMMGGPGGPN